MLTPQGWCRSKKNKTSWESSHKNPPTIEPTRPFEKTQWWSPGFACFPNKTPKKTCVVQWFLQHQNRTCHMQRWTQRWRNQSTKEFQKHLSQQAFCFPGGILWLVCLSVDVCPTVKTETVLLVLLFFFVLPGVSMITIIMTLTTRFVPTKIRSLVLNNPWLLLGRGVEMMQLTSDVIQHLFVVLSVRPVGGLPKVSESWKLEKKTLQQLEAARTTCYRRNNIEN